MSENFQELRHKFYERVLSTPSASPATALPMLCGAWKELTGATFVWLFLYNEAADQWEVIAFAPYKDSAFGPQSLVPLNNFDHESVVEYVNLTKKPIIITDLNWTADYANRKFRVVCAEEFRRLGCQGIVCVPLLAPEALPGSRSIRAAICASFTSNIQDLQPNGSLLLMGRLSASCISDSYQFEQQAILVQLNALAEKYLTRRTRFPEKQRRLYCEEIIALLQNHLGVNWVSIFYQNESKDMVHCIATTGLWDYDGNEIDKKAPADAYYLPHQSITGEVFAACEPFFANMGTVPHRSERHPHYLFRETPLPHDESALPRAIYPINPPISQSEKERGSFALGVIRCVGNKSWFSNQQLRNFDPIQIQTLEFISHQLAPVLETMAVHIERERAVSIIKHDLFAPLRMIEDEVIDITQNVEKRQSVNPYSLPNLSAASMIAKNLVGMLDADPEDALRTYEPQPTGLEGDIVARVKSMLSHYAWAANRMNIVFEPIRDTIPRISIDRNLTERVLCNLILNAVKYGKGHTVIQVVPRVEAAWYCLDIVNEGIGVGLEDEARIFRGRYRGINARRSGKKGLGLGLKISRAAMDKQQGRLILTSGKKESTVFTIQFSKKLAT